MRVVLCLFLCGCFGSPSGGIAPGTRVITGRALQVSTDEAPRQRPALQAVALFHAESCGQGVSVGDGVCAFFGDPFDAGVRGGGVATEPFRLAAPCDVTVNIFIQVVEGGGPQAPGRLLGGLAFPSGTNDEVTTLLAAEPECRDTPKLATNIIDLGEFTVPSSPAAQVPAVLIGGPDGGVNPLSIVDTDQDLSPNASDDDDDDDGREDSVDTDDDGDGVDDRQQSVTGFPI